MKTITARIRELPLARLLASFVVALFVYAALYRGDLGDALAIVLGSAFIMGLIYLPTSAARPSLTPSVAAEELAAAVLRNRLPPDYVVLTNHLVPSRRSSVGSVEVDILVIGPNGIFNVEVKSHEGHVYADETARQWSVESPRGNGVLRNPVQQAKAQAGALRDYLREKGIVGPVRSAIYMPNASLVTRAKLSLPIYGTATLLPAFILAAEPGSTRLDVTKAVEVLRAGHASVPPR